MCGKSGSGKDFLVQKFKENSFTANVKYTTRPRRKEEIENIDYHYVDDDTFSLLVQCGVMKVIESFNNWKYGTTHVSWNHSQVFILPPSIIKILSSKEILESYIIYLDIDDKILENRLIKRENNDDSVQQRMKNDLKDFDSFPLDICDKIITDEKFDPLNIIGEMIN